MSYLTLQAGTPVLSTDGRHVGVVKLVLADEAADIFDGIVVETEDGDRFADATEVGEIRADAVLLTLSHAEADRLPRPGENPGVLEHHGSKDAETPLEQKLRRAWELISGKG